MVARISQAVVVDSSMLGDGLPPLSQNVYTNQVCSPGRTPGLARARRLLEKGYAGAAGSAGHAAGSVLEGAGQRGGSQVRPGRLVQLVSGA